MSSKPKRGFKSHSWRIIIPGDSTEYTDFYDLLVIYLFPFTTPCQKNWGPFTHAEKMTSRSSGGLQFHKKPPENVRLQQCLGQKLLKCWNFHVSMSRIVVLQVYISSVRWKKLLIIRQHSYFWNNIPNFGRQNYYFDCPSFEVAWSNNQISKFNHI